MCPGGIHDSATKQNLWPGLTCRNRQRDSAWATLLHLAIEHDPPFVEVALAHGVHPEVRDATFNATATGWAEHFGRRTILQRLAQTPKR
jgi:hypothetical protein